MSLNFKFCRRTWYRAPVGQMTGSRAISRGKVHNPTHTYDMCGAFTTVFLRVPHAISKKMHHAPTHSPLDEFVHVMTAQKINFPEGSFAGTKVDVYV